MSQFKTTIGLEIHVELNTKRKIFCDCANPASLKSGISEREPNTFCCPVCMGFPGTLPKTNELAIKYVRLAGLALNCELSKNSKFDRKHYFYPDLPKGYQISQYDMPFCKNGWLEIRNPKSEIRNKFEIQNSNDQNEDKIKVRINRVHLEEDAGKLIHPKDSNESLVDLNRAGTPLVEIVTEPDLHSPSKAAEFVKQLREVIRATGISQADMEKGHLRCDANIDVSTGNHKSPIVEIKNLNSFRFIEKALEFEVLRLQEDINNWPKEKSKITRGFNSKTGETYEQRRKEEAADYRYFPEPDLPNYTISDGEIKKLKTEISDLPEDVENQLSEIGLNKEQISLLSSDSNLRKIFDVILKNINDPKLIISYLMLIRGVSVRIPAEELIKLLQKIKSGNITNEIGKRVILQIAEGKKTEEVLEEYKKSEYNLDEIIEKVISENQKAVDDFKNGRQNAIGFLIGQVMKKTKGAADPQEVSKSIINKLK